MDERGLVVASRASQMVYPMWWRLVGADCWMRVPPEVCAEQIAGWTDRHSYLCPALADLARVLERFP